MREDVLQPQDVVEPGFCHVSKRSGLVVAETTKSHLLGTGGHNLSSGISSCISKSRCSSACVSRLCDGYEMDGIRKMI